MMYGTWLMEWLRKRAPYLKAATAALYEENAVLHILPLLGEVPIADLTEERLLITL